MAAAWAGALVVAAPQTQSVTVTWSATPTAVGYDVVSGVSDVGEGPDSRQASALPASFLKANRCDLRDRGGAGEVVYLRGVNLGGWLYFEGWMCPGVIDTATNNPHQEDVEAVLTQRFGLATKDALTAAYQSAWIGEADLDLVAAAGMNLVRVPFTYSVFQEQPQDPSVPLAQVVWKPEAEAFSRMDWLVSACAQRRIYVVFDFHHPEGGASQSGLYGHPGYQDRFVEIWRRMAAHFAGNPTVAGYDLVNESGGATNLNAVWDRAYQAIRAVDPDHVVVAEYYSIAKTTAVMDRYGWENVMASTHDYWSDGISVYNELMAARSAGPGTTVCPYFVGEFMDNSNDTPRIRYYSDAGAPWCSWTLKTVNQMDWSMLNALNNGASSPGDVPNLSTDSAADISAKWAKWTTHNPAVRYTPTCNRLSSPVARDDAFWLMTNGPFFFTAQSLLANDADLSSLRQLAVTSVPVRTANGTIAFAANAYLYQPDPGFSGTDTFTYVAVDERLRLPSAYPATVNLSVPPPGVRLPLTLMAAGAEWRYFDRTNDLGAAWRSPSYDDATWGQGPAMLGFGDANGILPATVVGSNRQWTTYFRHRFSVPDAGLVSSLEARLLRDDGAVVYVNGVEAWRDTNMPPGLITNQTPALTALGGAAESAWLTNALDPALLVTGTNLFAVEVHQNARTSSDLALDFALTGSAIVSSNVPITFVLPGAGPVLTWPADAAYFRLYSSTGLTAGAVWTRAPGDAVLTNGVWAWPVHPSTRGEEFFRLQAP